MKKASDLYSLTRRELILLEMFNMLDDEEQVQRLCSLSGYLLGRKILSEDDLILSILVDTFISKISFPIQPCPEIGSISDA